MRKGFCSLLLILGTALCSAQDGIRCKATHGGRVNVTAEQWKVVRDALTSHDVKRMAPFISDKEVTETSVRYKDMNDWEKNWPRSREESAYSEIKTKKQFLKDVSELKFYDKDGTVSTGAGTPGLVFAYVFVYLRQTYPPLREVHSRSDVWRQAGSFLGKEFGFCRVRFVCENGWLKIAEFKVFFPTDP